MATDEKGKSKTKSTGIIPGQFQGNRQPNNPVSSKHSDVFPVQKGYKRTPSPFLDRLDAYFVVEPGEFPGDPDALPYVKELVGIECDHKIQWDEECDAGDAMELQLRRRRDELIQIICRDYPDTAKKLLLQDLVSPKKETNDSGSAKAESKVMNRAMAIGRNIDTLRKECGWSLDKLARETGIDKKSILSHVNKGVRPIPRLLAEYAQAFSKTLGRKITAPDLEK
jgi:hypothetical protein